MRSVNMNSAINESLVSKVFYCMATASARTQHVTVGDIIVSINGESMFTTPKDAHLYAGDTDAYFDAVRAKIVAAKAPRVARFIRFFRNIYRGRIVAPRDAKLSHTEMSHLFEPAHLVAMTTFRVGEAEPRVEDEDARVREAREAGASSFVFDVVFPDTGACIPDIASTLRVVYPGTSNLLGPKTTDPLGINLISPISPISPISLPRMVHTPLLTRQNDRPLGH